MDRKKFIITSTLTAIGLSTFGSIMKMPNGTFNGDCETTNDILGPFYRPDAPIRSNLISEGLAGTRIALKGKIYASDCVTPLKNALVEIWHCNADGDYDNDSKEFNQRASLVTNADGAYSFLTIIPGKYLNGELYRPSHIHYRVTEEHSKELISQIYFRGDPHIEKDPWASNERAALRILEISPEDLKGHLAVNFDIYLREK
jgi:protocatechuate 3,4-dioxygenase beta subunit